LNRSFNGALIRGKAFSYFIKTQNTFTFIFNQNRLLLMKQYLLLENNWFFFQEFFFNELIWLNLTLKSQLPAKAFKPRVGITLEFLSNYQETLFIATPFSLKIIIKYLNPSQINGRIQTITIKARRLFCGLFHLCHLLAKLSYLSLKPNNGPMYLISHGCKIFEGKKKRKGIDTGESTLVL